MTRFINDMLLAAPSIIIGLFVYAVYVAQAKHFSGWAGAFALALLVIPVVVRTTDDMLRLQFKDRGKVLAYPGPNRLKLFEEPVRRYFHRPFRGKRRFLCLRGNYYSIGGTPLSL